MEYPTLRTANIARQAEWLKGRTLPLTFRTNEMAGECGEVAELLLNRWGVHSHMYGAWITSLADEMSDVVICADLGCMFTEREVRPLNIELLAAQAQRISTDYRWCAELLRDAGLACNAAKKRDRGIYGIAGADYGANVLGPITKVAQHMFDLAYQEHINLEGAIARKFNGTSKKVGLSTLYIPPGFDRAVLIP